MVVVSYLRGESVWNVETREQVDVNIREKMGAATLRDLPLNMATSSPGECPAPAERPTTARQRRGPGRLRKQTHGTFTVLPSFVLTIATS